MPNPNEEFPKVKMLMTCLLCILAALAIGMGIDHLNGRFSDPYDDHLDTAHKFHEAMHEAKMQHSHPMPIRRPPNSKTMGLSQYGDPR